MAHPLLFKQGVEQRAFRVLRGWRMYPMLQRTNGLPADLLLREQWTLPRW